MMTETNNFLVREIVDNLWATMEQLFIHFKVTIIVAGGWQCCIKRWNFAKG